MPVDVPSRVPDSQGSLELPPPPAPLGAYEPWVRTGSLVLTSGQFPFVDGRLAYEGSIGGQLTPEQGYDACRLACLNALAQLNAAAGSLTGIARILRLEGTLQVARGYRDAPAALDGASDLVNEVFGSRGRHSRMIFTNADMPLNTPVLLVVVAEVRE